MAQTDIFKLLKKGHKPLMVLRKELVPSRLSKNAFNKNISTMKKHGDIIKNDKGDYQINEAQ